MKFVDPKNDFAFKKIFADETKKEILISLLNAILSSFTTLYHFKSNILKHIW